MAAGCQDGAEETAKDSGSGLGIWATAAERNEGALERGAGAGSRGGEKALVFQACDSGSVLALQAPCSDLSPLLREAF